MSLPKSVADVIAEHVVFETESIDRMYLNVYQPSLQIEPGAAVFFRRHRGEAFATAYVMAKMTRAFVSDIERFVEQQHVPLVVAEKGVRKEEVVREHLARFDREEGVVLVMKAQEKATVFRTVKRRCAETGRTYPWLIKSTAMVNHYYFYCVDKDFGPFFLKFCSYFPYNARLCLNGHEYAKRQLAQRGIPFEALDNGVLACDDPARLQQICDGLSHEKIDRLLRKWLARLPHPFTAADRHAGYRYDLSILQAEFSLTQVVDRPQSGRIFFERVIHDNLDLGRPDKVQLIFDRRVLRNTRARFRTRVITEHVIPSLWIDYKSSTIKQYFKEGRALRTETTINNTNDFQIGRRINNLPKLRAVAFAANRRLLRVQQIDHDPTVGQDTFDELTRPREVDGQRVSGLRFGDPLVLAVMTALLMFRLLPEGFSNRHLREILARLLVRPADQITPGQMSYQLRRLRLRGMIERLPNTHRYRLTEKGIRTALFYTCSLSQVIRPLSACLDDPNAPLQQRILRRLQPLVEEAIPIGAAA
jgi:DNA-binding MarR family transcriptional regulator